MRRPVILLVSVALLALVGWLFPPFRLVPLRASRAEEAGKAFDAAAFATTFWRERLVPGLTRAADAATVLDGLRRNPVGTARQHGRSLGLSDAVLYTLAGTGTIVAVEDRGFTVALAGAEGPGDLLLRTGLLFGNTVRDATGLLDVNAFANSQDFNGISAELNRIVETEVLPGLKSAAAVGKRIQFTVVLEVASGAEGDRPLTAIPLRGRIE